LTHPAVWPYLVNEATQRIRRGELDKVVLARARHVQAERPVDPVVALAHLAQNYPDCYRFLFEPVPGHAFYGATPELLVQIKDATLYTVAMAGSIKRGSSPEEDEVLAAQLMANPKERHEHALVVEAIEENLRPLAETLDVPDQPGLCRLTNIQHLKTPIQGRLPEKERILGVIEVLHPTPAVGGRPRDIALGMIPQMEPTPRGWYAAPIGWLDRHGNGMFSVAIRSAVSVRGESLLYAGAGIVADSQPEKEWHETQLKFRPLQEALNGAVSA
jgi:menaquinone-specific isochorismate synthase